jgi:hypothetical protein
MDALMHLMRRLHHDPMNTSMFDVEAYAHARCLVRRRVRPWLSADGVDGLSPPIFVHCDNALLLWHPLSITHTHTHTHTHTQFVFCNNIHTLSLSFRNFAIISIMLMYPSLRCAVVKDVTKSLSQRVRYTPYICISK